MNKTLLESAQHAKAWPFEIARKILKQNPVIPQKGYILLETGYGPSGLPHIGTYCEVIRTKMVQNALKTLSDIPTKIIVVSDDMDGLKKVPDNMPNSQMLEKHLQLPLTAVPDPFEMYESYGEYMNAQCREFLDRFDCEYEFKSATDLYKKGIYDEFLLKTLENYDKIMKIMLPTLGEERQKTYSPFLPICPETGRVLYVSIIQTNIDKGTITYVDDDRKKEVVIPVTGGNCKLQWKPDFGMRWAALDVDFEMYGKDHFANAQIYSSICKVLGGKIPEQFCYEMFLDDEGKKISKSKGNGITIGEWLKYAPIESLSFYMYQSPRKAKKLFFDVIPKSVDEYIIFMFNFHNSSPEEQINNPVWHVHDGHVPEHNVYGLTFNLLLNLACACNPENKDVLWGFIYTYAPDASPDNDLFLDKLVGYAVRYYEDFIKPNKTYKVPSKEDAKILSEIRNNLEKMDKNEDPKNIQSVFYNAGKESHYDNLREFFKMVYETLLGQAQGPRLGSFVRLYGIEKSIALIDSALKTM